MEEPRHQHLHQELQGPLEERGRAPAAKAFGGGSVAEAPVAAAAVGLRPPRGLYDQAPESELEEVQREKAGRDGVITPWVYPGSRPSTRTHGGGVG